MSMRIRTGYSFRRAAGKIEDVISRLQEIGSPYAPITDTASTFGFNRWKRAATEASLKPIFGVELAVSTNITAKKPVVDYWTFIARDSLAPLNRLIGQATAQFRYEPLLTIDQAASAQSLIKIIGHRSDVTQIQPGEDLYFGLGPAVTKGYAQRCIEQGIPPIAVCDNRYVRSENAQLYEVIAGRNASLQSYPQHILSDNEWECSIPWAIEPMLSDALYTRNMIREQCTVDLPRGEMIVPETQFTLEQLCRQGAEQLGCDLTRPEYAQRLQHELQLINAKKFEDYFYIVADIVNWARDRMLVGPARGSSCGSLVCYLLRITTIDPLRFGLMFERFIDETRDDYPDIDIDFSDQRRELAFEYVAQKYGEEHVARLGAVGTFGAKSALKETGVALDAPMWRVQTLTDIMERRFEGDTRAKKAIEDAFNETSHGQDFVVDFPEMRIAQEVEGHPRNATKHAAGVIITKGQVTDYIAIDRNTGAIQCDKKDAEELNLLKIDALGLTQLSIFEDCLELIGKDRDFLFSIPLDDEAAFDVLNKRQFAGIFQLNQTATQMVVRQLEHVKSFSDFVAIVALSRPGPNDTGGTKRWLDVQNGKSQPIYEHPALEPLLRKTHGVVAFQEQVMNICRIIGDMPWPEVMAVRKAMGKTLGKEYLSKWGDMFIKGAVEKGFAHDVASHIWDELCTHGAYSFNESHAVAYAHIAYWSCYLKAHFPLQYAAGVLSNTDDDDAQLRMLRELAAEGVSYVPVDAEHSGSKWTVGVVDGSPALVGPLSNVVGIGPKLTSAILSARARGEPLSERLRKLLEVPKTKIDSLFPIRDRIKYLLPDPSKRAIFSEPRPLSQVQAYGAEYEVLVFCVLEQIKQRDENEEDRLAKRNGKTMGGPTAFLNLRLVDDTDSIFARINRYNFADLGKPVLDQGRAGKALYAVKGNVPKNFRMIDVKGIRYIGDMEKE